MDVEGTVRRVIGEEGLIEPGEKVLVAVSGGIDSSALLFLLDKIKNEIPISLGVVHVNHGLRGAESERDEAFVRASADRLSLPCHVLKADVRAYGRAEGVSVQHAGRDIRYRYFDEVCEAHGYEKVAIAHNRDDQVETFLLRVIKGTGINGLTSIPIRRGRIIRPLLRTYRSEIEAFVIGNSVPFIEDSSNRKDTYERNFVRLYIMPLMERLNPRFREKVLLLLSDICSVDLLFEEQATRFLDEQGLTDSGEARLSASALRLLHPETRFRVVSRVLAGLEPRFIALREHVLLVNKSLFSDRPNNSVTLPHGIKVERAYDKMVFTRNLPITAVCDTVKIRQGENTILPLGINARVSFAEHMPLTFPGGPVAFFDADKASILSIRTFRPGDRFVPLGMAGSVKLKDYFMGRKIPREKRRTIPLLLSGQDIIWIVGERIDERYKVTDKTTRVLKVEIEPLSLAP